MDFETVLAEVKEKIARRKSKFAILMLDTETYYSYLEWYRKNKLPVPSVDVHIFDSCEVEVSHSTGLNGYIFQ